MMERPVLRYAGGKFRIAKWIISHMPRHDVYVEPFGGGAAVLINKPKVKQEIYNDLNEEVVHVFRILQDREKAKELSYRLQYTPFSRSEYEKAFSEQPTDDIDRARFAIIRSFMGMGACGLSENSKTGFDIILGIDRYNHTAQAWSGYHRHIATFCERLQGVVLENKDAIDLIKGNDRPYTLFYVDPPYTPDTWKGSYAKNTDAAYHERLIDTLLSVKGMVILSGYENPLYAERLADWQKFSKHTICFSLKPRTETIWISPNAARKSNTLF